MGQVADLAVSQMVDAFQSKTLVETYLTECDGIPDLFVARAANSARLDKSRRFAPTPKALREDASELERLSKCASRNPEPYKPAKGASPYEIGLAKMERDFEGYKLAAKNIALHVFNERAREEKYPPGTRWQAGRVYIPDSVKAQL